ncbi:MAG: GNAT family N-acetyltransferase [Candidatus Hydrogenedentes bacterium]|nr:GNAT family N-acetyltransferase [Candidatus Hydrogenedentota bacterium]
MALKSSVFLRRADRDDLETVVAWMEDPAFQRFLYGDPARSPKQIREQIIGMLGRANPMSMPAAVYCMADSKKLGPVGLFQVVNISWRNRSCNLDSYICEKRRNGFHGAIAFFRMLDYCFTVLNMHRVNIYIYGFNARSWRIFEFSGTPRELVLEEHVARDGKLYAMYGYGVLREDFERLKEINSKSFRGGDLRSMINDLRELTDSEATA